MEYVIIAVAVVVFLIIIVAIGYVKAPPNRAYIISGMRKRKKILIGRAGFRLPLIERLDKLSLDVMQVDIKTSEAIPYFMKAKELGEQLVAANPKAFSLEYCLILKNLATAYDDSGNPTQAEAYARDVLTRIEKLYHDNPSSFEYKTEYESVVRIAKKLGLPVNELPAAGS